MTVPTTIPVIFFLFVLELEVPFAFLELYSKEPKSEPSNDPLSSSLETSRLLSLLLSSRSPLLLEVSWLSLSVDCVLDDEDVEEVEPPTKPVIGIEGSINPAKVVIVWLWTLLLYSILELSLINAVKFLIWLSGK